MKRRLISSMIWYTRCLLYTSHVVGVAKGVSADILADLRANFEGECSEVGMYLAMARVAHREGYPEVGMYYQYPDSGLQGEPWSPQAQ